MAERAVVAMSGGVDSAVAAALIREAGYDAIGVTMRLFHNEDAGIPRENSCCSLDDVEDARSVAIRLGIPYYVFDFSDRFRCDVIDRFIHAYETGETPNPCIDCNRYLKFERLYERARELGYDYVVTGHYARVERDPGTGRFLLKKGIDPTKDQSYVLYSLTQEQLSHTLFPLGGYRKAEVREMAAARGFCNARKHDSQDICFVQNGDYADFITSYTGRRYPPGHFVNAAGQVIGTHRGIIHYTIGQRKGLGIAAAEPLYVTAVDPETNTVTLGRNADLMARGLVAGAVNLIDRPSLDTPTRVTAKVRYRHAEQPALAWQSQDGALHVLFDAPQRAITPGQAVVLYDGDTVVGGGTIRCAVPDVSAAP